MVQLVRKKALLAKIESTYGTDPTPTGSANAILLKNLNISPQNANQVGRELIRPYLGNFENINADTHVEMDFEVEIAGAGIAGSVPAWGPLLRACGMAQAATTQSAAITRTSGTATLTANAHGFSNGDTVTVSGATQTEYNGAVVISNVTTNTFDYTVTGAPATPATGTPVIAKTVAYTPISDSLESITLYFYVDGVRHKVTGARGSFEISLVAKQIPTFKFKFLGLYNAPTDTALPSTVYTAFTTPLIANNTNTTGFSFFSYSAVLESLTLNVNNQVDFRALIGSETVNITDRKPSGQVMFEAPALATKDFFAIGLANTLGALSVTHGTANGNKVAIAAPYVDIGNPSYAESQGINMLSIPYQPTPSSSGNDEFSITAK